MNESDREADVPAPAFAAPGDVAGMADAADPVIELSEVRKRFGRTVVLDGLGLQVRRGEVFGFLGRNGAGKSTAIRVLMGIVPADAGQVRLFGQPLSSGVVAARRRIGYVAQDQNMYPWMTPRVLGRFVRGFYPRWDETRWRQLNAAFGLPMKRRLGTFSGGMKAKLALALALATRPELLILDEPTAGMDPVARREFLDLVREQTARDGATTFFSTHLIDEIEAIADRIAIVEGGRTLYQGPLAPLAERTVGYSIALRDDVPGTLPLGSQAPVARVLGDAPRLGRRQVVLQLDGASSRDAEPLPGWRCEPLTLEDVFIAMVGGRGDRGGQGGQGGQGGMAAS